VRANPAGHSGSRVPFSAMPTISPRLLILKVMPFCPPVGKRKLVHHTLFPHVRQTSETGTVEAKVFVVGIFLGDLSLSRSLAPFIDAIGYAVQSCLFGRGDVFDQPLLPEGRVLFPVRERRQAGNRAILDHDKCQAEVTRPIPEFRDR